MCVIQEIFKFIKLVISLSFADNISLGYSPIITPVKIGQGTGYEFKLNGIIYVTTGTVLSEFRAR